MALAIFHARRAFHKSRNSPLSDNLPVRGNGYDVQRNILTAVFDGGFDCIAEAAAAGYSHPCDGDGADIVVLENFSQLLRIVHSIQLGAADHSHLILHEIVVEIAVGISSAIRSDQQICAIEIGGTQRQQLDLHREVGQFTGDIHIRRRSGMGTLWQAEPGQAQGSGASFAFFAASTAASL